MSTAFLIVGMVALTAGTAVFGVSAKRARRGVDGRWLLGTVLVAAGLLALVSGWLLTEPNPNRGEALKTGGLAAGSVVALYALWLNDRRRRVDEERQDVERRRQDLESARAEHDRERVADERFARAVELLGSDADQVRVGALHALAGLARNRPYYTQTVLDVFCSYLRRPFNRSALDEHELQVRRTAQRLIADLLPPPDSDLRYDLDLTGADLEYFDLGRRAVGTLVMRHTVLHSSNALSRMQVWGDAWFTGAVNHGNLYIHDSTFHRKAWFSGFISRGPALFSRTRFHGPTKFAGSRFLDRLDLSGEPNATRVRP
ncbi:hypothetical protein [Actinokineospora iranica]|uniref:Pentapeptide repeat-containing protein n=1 Tax=Actinokineospora iranica TaxID=1271860 RepID=A0A1G6QBF1_9PSEU|nr:hypothetical protein [Actinokineospora iranica]SDC89006.1 hypothetical protein SAMN05216174_105164 [Actinokineospora iranica]